MPQRERIVAQLAREIGAEEQRVELEGDLRRIGTRIEMAFLFREPNRLLERRKPVIHRSGDRVAHRAGSAVEFKRGGGEEASTRKHAATQVVQPLPAEGHETRITPRRA